MKPYGIAWFGYSCRCCQRLRKKKDQKRARKRARQEGKREAGYPYRESNPGIPAENREVYH